MAIGFPARFAENRTFNLPEDELVAVIDSALRTLGWPYKITEGKVLQARVSHGPWSWGEELTAEIFPGGRIQAKSKSAGHTPALIDFGNNKRNVEAFFAMIEHCSRQEVHQQPISETSVGSVKPGTLAGPKHRWAGSLFGGCLMLLLIIGIFIYFISAVIGLLTGSLFLPGRGHPTTIHGSWARILSVLILMIFAWTVVRMLRNRKQRLRL